MVDYYHTTANFEDGPDHDTIFESFRGDGSSQPLNHQPSSTSPSPSYQPLKNDSSTLSGEMMVLVGVIIMVFIVLLDATIFGYFIFRRDRRKQATNKNTDEGISQSEEDSTPESTEDSEVENGSLPGRGRVLDDENEDEQQHEFDEDGSDDSSSVTTVKTATSDLGSIV